MSDFYLEYYTIDNSKVYLQDGDKPPKGAIVHKGPLDGRYYDPDERPLQYVHISPERKTFLSWLESQGSAGLDITKDIADLPDEVTYKRGYRDRFEIGKEILALERIGVIYRDGDIYHISDEGKQALTQDGEIRVIDRIKREEQLSSSPFRSGVWREQDLKKLSKYVNVPTFGLTEVYPPVLGDDLSDYTKFKSAGLVDHQPYIYYRMDEKVEFALSSDEIFKYCQEHSNEFDNICAKEGRAYVMDELRKAHDAIRMNRHNELDLSSSVVQALIMDDVIVRNRGERIVLTEAGEKALKEGSYSFSLPKTQISQSITDEAMLGLDKSQFPVSNYFLSTNTDITPIEMRSIIEYKANWFDAVNRALLRGTEPIPEETNNMIACLDNLISRSVIKEPCTLYNGCPTEVSNMMLSGEFSAGDILQLDTFTSTSLDREVAGMFSNNDVILKIEQPENSTGFFYGTEETEQEVLLPRGTQLRIKEIRKVPRFHEFYGGLEKDGSLTWDTLTDDEKDKALDDGYCEVPTKERNFDTLSSEEQEMMGKTIVFCERISGVQKPEDKYRILEGRKVVEKDRAEQEHIIQSSRFHTRTYPEGLKDTLQIVPEGTTCERWWAAAGDIVYELEAMGILQSDSDGHNRTYILSDVGKEVLKGSYDHPNGEIQVPPPKHLLASVDDPEGHYDGRLSPHELIAMGDYKGYYYTGINQTLINNPDAERNTSDKYNYDEVLETIALLDHVIGRCNLQEEVYLYNGASVNVSKMLLLGDVHEGDIFQLDTFTSTSLDEDVAEGFCSEIFDDDGKKISEGVVIKIHQPANCPCFYYGGDADALAEQEVLLPRNTRIKITKIDKKPFFTVVECERVSGIKEVKDVQADNSKVYLQGDEKPPKGVPVYKGPQDGRYYNTEDVPDSHDCPLPLNEDGEYEFGKYTFDPDELLVEIISIPPKDRSPLHQYYLKIASREYGADDDTDPYGINVTSNKSILDITDEQADRLLEGILQMNDERDQEYITIRWPRGELEFDWPTNNIFLEMTGGQLSRLSQSMGDSESEDALSENLGIDVSDSDDFFGSYEDSGYKQKYVVPSKWILALTDNLKSGHIDPVHVKSFFRICDATNSHSTRDKITMSNLIKYVSFKETGKELSESELGNILKDYVSEDLADNKGSDWWYNRSVELLSSSGLGTQTVNKSESHKNRWDKFKSESENILKKYGISSIEELNEMIPTLKYEYEEKSKVTEVLRGEYHNIYKSLPIDKDKLQQALDKLEKSEKEKNTVYRKYYDSLSDGKKYADFVRKANAEKKQYILESGNYQHVSLVDSPIPTHDENMSEATIDLACEKYGLDKDKVKKAVHDWVFGITPYVSKYMWNKFDTLEKSDEKVELLLVSHDWPEEHVAEVCDIMDKLYSVSRVSRSYDTYRGTSFRQVCEMFGVDNLSAGSEDLDPTTLINKVTMCGDYSSWTYEKKTGYLFASERAGAFKTYDLEEYAQLDEDYDPYMEEHDYDDDEYPFKSEIVADIAYPKFLDDNEHTIHILKSYVDKGDHAIYIGNTEPFYESEIVMGRGKKYRLDNIIRKPDPRNPNITMIIYELTPLAQDTVVNLSGVMI